VRRDRAEAAATAAIAGAIAGLALPRRLRVPGVALAALAGAVAGHRGIYDWGHRSGVAAFVADSSWALTGAVGGVSVLALQRIIDPDGYRPDLSVRRNRHVYEGGFTFRRGFIVTSGNVVTNAAANTATVNQRRVALIDRHEDLHIWQQRAFGPLYPLLYGGWAVIGAAIGALVWLVRPGTFDTTVTTIAYYDNPFEVWAYRNDRNWPPRAADPDLLWR